MVPLREPLSAWHHSHPTPSLSEFTVPFFPNGALRPTPLPALPGWLQRPSSHPGIVRNHPPLLPIPRPPPPTPVFLETSIYCARHRPVSNMVLLPHFTDQGDKVLRHEAIYNPQSVCLGQTHFCLHFEVFPASLFLRVQTVDPNTLPAQADRRGLHRIESTRLS